MSEEIQLLSSRLVHLVATLLVAVAFLSFRCSALAAPGQVPSAESRLHTANASTVSPTPQGGASSDPGSQAAPNPSSTAPTQWWSSFLTPQVIVALIAAFGSGGWIGGLIVRHLDHRSKHIVAVRQLHIILRSFERQISIVRDFPGLQPIADLSQLLGELKAMVLSADSLGVLSDHEHVAVGEALIACEDSCKYLAAQQYPVTDATRRTEIGTEIRRSLVPIYRARDVLKDFQELRWPPDPENRRYWSAGNIIPRNEDYRS